MIVSEPYLGGRFTPNLGQVVGVIDAVLVEAAANLQGCVASNVVEGKPSRRVVQEGHPAYIAEWLRRGEGACIRVDQVPEASREPAWIIGGRVRIASPGAGARLLHSPTHAGAAAACKAEVGVEEVASAARGCC